jgi:hypothetical protein
MPSGRRWHSDRRSLSGLPARRSRPTTLTAKKMLAIIAVLALKRPLELHFYDAATAHVTVLVQGHAVKYTIAFKDR